MFESTLESIANSHNVTLTQGKADPRLKSQDIRTTDSQNPKMATKETTQHKQTLPKINRDSLLLPRSWESEAKPPGEAHPPYR
jgi:hypothetical protein